MQFMIIRRADAATEADIPPSAPLIAEMEAYFRSLADAGALVMVQGLAPSREALRLHLGPGGSDVAAGPFDLRELAAGFLVVEADAKEDAVAWARRWPAAEAAANGGLTLEVREAGCVGGCVEVPLADGAGGKRYVILLRSDADCERDAVPEQARLDALDAFNAAQAAAGVLLAGDGLMSSSRGARVHIDARGASTVVDGPFAEAKELIAGFWMIRADSMAAALAWARTVPYPTGPGVVVEIRAQHADGEPATAAALSPEEARADASLRAGLLDDALRDELAPRLA
ncbi:YciI family protein [uncultured Massilia sp.]|uniref:YciI family protein n=1 Tax=uncultured Massilia sp. TaxID=169973 RepID=UPI0025F9D048|nr:YciI family protein [uncultured Massilia sp.]